MEYNQRLMALAQASDDVLARVDAVLEGRDRSVLTGPENNRLMTVMDAARYLSISYPKIYRIMRDGLLDIVDATGRRMVREQSVIEFSKGLRKPSSEVLARRAARNTARREEYRRQHPKMA